MRGLVTLFIEPPSYLENRTSSDAPLYAVNKLQIFKINEVKPAMAYDPEPLPSTSHAHNTFS
jgi:hypothetical protein